MKNLKDFKMFVEDNSQDIDVNEKKKMNAGLKAYLDKKSGKKAEKSDDKKSDEKKDKKKGLTAGQKKLPDALQQAILKRQSK